MLKRLLIPILLVLMAFVPASAQESPLQVVATTTIIADVALQVGGDRVEVVSLVPAGADEHAYQPTPQDIARVARADVVLVNGAGLEEFLATLVGNAAGVQPVVISNGIRVLAYGGHAHDHDEHADEEHSDEHADEHAMDEAIIGVLGVDAICEADHDDHGHEEDADHADEAHSDEHADEAHADEEHAHDHDHGECDPHFWGDPRNVMIWADNIAATFTAADPANANFYAANADAYKAELEALDAELEALLATIPAERRVLVTNHEFLAYFAARYGFEVVGVVLGATTLAEPTPQNVAALVEVIREEGVRAIFSEATASARLAEVIAAEAGGDVIIATLYSGSLSPADGPAATYIDYMRYNAQVILEALTADL